MKKVIKLLLVVTSFTIVSCAGKEEKKVTENTTPADMKELVNKVEEGSKTSNDRRQKRREKGDTLAMPYKDLQAYLPDIDGYEKSGGPKGSQMNTPMGSWSQAEQDYENGVKRINVTIVDYNSAFETFRGLTAVYGMGFSSEDDEKKTGPANLGKDGVAGYETIYKTSGRGELVLVVADRFIINIKTEGENNETMLRSIAKAIKLDEMVKL